MSYKVFSISLSEELFQEIEKKRGLVPRSTYIVHLLSNLFKDEELIAGENKYNLNGGEL